MKKTIIATSLALSMALASPIALAAPTVPQVLETYANVVHANYEDTLMAAKDMQKAIAAFVANPSTQTQDAAKKAWLNAREYYGQTEAFRFYGGPIDDDNGPEGQINAWPMDESYVDSVKGKATAGLINNTAFEITKASLAEQNERGGEENIATGWHAIEFFLWGQDLNANGPGQRSYTDFVDGKSKNADRRRKYLTVVTELLIDDLTMVTGEWRAGSKVNYRSKFVKGGNESLRKMLVGLGSLSRGELAGERMEVALNSRDQEDEHSCFSDNTHRDVVANAQGIQNVWLGSYRRADGTVVKGASLAELVAAKNKAAADKTSKQLAESVAAANAIKPPFDQEILNNEGRARIQRTIKSLVQQSKDIVSAANAVGISKLTLVQP